jgi:hypothetical protein
MVWKVSFLHLVDTSSVAAFDKKRASDIHRPARKRGKAVVDSFFENFYKMTLLQKEEE